MVRTLRFAQRPDQPLYIIKIFKHNALADVPKSKYTLEDQHRLIKQRQIWRTSLEKLPLVPPAAQSSATSRIPQPRHTLNSLSLAALTRRKNRLRNAAKKAFGVTSYTHTTRDVNNRPWHDRAPHQMRHARYFRSLRARARALGVYVARYKQWRAAAIAPRNNPIQPGDYLPIDGRRERACAAPTAPAYRDAQARGCVSATNSRCCSFWEFWIWLYVGQVWMKFGMLSLLLLWLQDNLMH